MFPIIIDDLVAEKCLNLPAEAVLPIDNEEKIGEGAYGVVYCSHFTSEYVNITVCATEVLVRGLR